VFVGLSNLHATETLTIDVDLSKGKVSAVSKATILTAPAFNSYNDFDSPEVVRPVPFENYNLSSGTLKVVLPPFSVVTFEME